MKSNPECHARSRPRTAFFTNVREDRLEGDVSGGRRWATKRGPTSPTGAATPWTPREREPPAAHPNARFTSPAGQPVPGDRSRVGRPEGRADQRDPLRWASRHRRAARATRRATGNHGTFLGSIISSEKTAAAAGQDRRSSPRPDGHAAVLRIQHGRLLEPLAGDRQACGRAAAEGLLRQLVPKSDGGDFLWPGFGDNGRVLKWIFERCEGAAKAVETPIGNLPAENALDMSGLDDLSREDMAELLRVDVDGWLAELPLIEEYYAQFGDRLPQQMSDELAAMKSRLDAAKS